MLYSLIIYCTNYPFLVHRGIDVNSLKSANNIGSIKKLVKYSDGAIGFRDISPVVKDTNLLEGGGGGIWNKSLCKKSEYFFEFSKAFFFVF